MISVVLTTYNGSNCIIDQLESLRLQTKEIDEVIILDDKSTDHTVNIVQEFIKAYNLTKWQIIVNEHNIGWKRNFIKGINLSKGKIILTCDQDDIWMPYKVEVISSILCLHPEINVLTTSWINWDGKKLNLSRACKKDDPSIALEKKDVKYNYLYNPAPGCVMAFRRTFYNRIIDCWQEDFPHDAFLYRAGIFTDSLYHLDEPMIYWRRHNKSSFSLDLKGQRTKKGKRDWIEYAFRVNKSIRIIEKKCDIIKYDYIIDLCDKWLHQRLKFYDTRSFLQWIRLIPLLKVYPKKSQLLTDIIYAYKDK